MTIGRRAFLGVVMGVFLTTPLSADPVVWTGPSVTFQKPAFADWTLPENQDRITDNVWITRKSQQGLFNIQAESSYLRNVSPSGTEWATGSAVDWSNLTFRPWELWTEADFSGPPSTPGANAVLHLIAADVYLDIRFLSWGQRPTSGGFFSYERSTAAPVLTLTSIIDGDWNTPQTWDDGSLTPSAADNVIVLGHAVAVSADAAALSLQIAEADGQIRIGASVRLELIESLTMATGSRLGVSVAGASAGRIDAGGDVSLGGILEMQIDANKPFEAGTHSLVTAGQIIGAFDASSGLGDYVSVGDSGDGLVYSDTTVTLTIDANLHPGDANLDTTTDVRDFNVWNTHKFTSGTDWTTGDFDGNGITDVRDFNVWNTAKFTSVGNGAPIVEGRVPEPAGLAMLAVATMFLLGYVARLSTGSSQASPTATTTDRGSVPGLRRLGPR